jgi:hypothetical protein
VKHPRSSPDKGHTGRTEELCGRAITPKTPNWANRGRTVGEGGGPTIEEVAEVPGMTTTGTDTGEPEAESPQRGPEGAAAGAGGGRGWQEGHEIKENDHIVIQETLTEPNLVLKEHEADH